MDSEINKSLNKKTSFFPPGLNVWLPLLLSGIMVVGMLLGINMVDNPPTISKSSAINGDSTATIGLGQGKLEELIRYIDSRYVDHVDRDSLVKVAISNILLQLDPHSSYISAEELKAVNDQMEGNFDGIGIEFIVVDDTVIITGIIPNSPAERAGIIANDKIVEIQDSTIVYKNLDHKEVLRLLKGKTGTSIIIGVLRNDEKSPRHFTVKREKIPVKSVEGVYMLDEQTGYIKIARFSSRTFEEFMNALDELVDNHGMKNLTLDLRQNPGGYLQEATNILSQLFKEKDKLLVYTKGRNVRNVEYKSTGRAFHDIGKVAVLVDEGSASASEIIAGAIQDWDRGLVIGRRTYGKGLVQEQYKLRDGTAIRLTVARYYTPSGRCIQKPYRGKNEYSHDLLDRIQSGEVYDESMFENPDTTKYFTKKGRLVYGGGGIQPDEFVAMNPDFMNPYYISIQRHIGSFVFRYLEKNHQKFAQWSLDEFMANYNPGETELNELALYASEHGVPISPAQSAKVRNEVLKLLKASIARRLWSDKGFYKVLNENDSVVEKARKLLKSPNPLQLAK